MIFYEFISECILFVLKQKYGEIKKLNQKQPYFRVNKTITKNGSDFY